MALNEPTKPLLFEYKDYRHYLADYHAYQDKRTNGKFSFRYFSKLAGFGSPNYVPQIIAGNKNISTEGIHRLAKAMEFTPKETEFFENLVLYSQATNPQEKSYYLNKLMDFNSLGTAHPFDPNQYTALTHWYVIALSELIKLPSFKPNLFWIAKKLLPAITPTQAREALETLEKLGLATKDKRLKWRATHNHLKTEDQVRNFAATHFHYQMISLAREALHQTASSREISSVTMSLSKTEFIEIKKCIIKFRNEIQKYLENSKDPSDRVYQLNIQLFPLTKS